MMLRIFILIITLANPLLAMAIELGSQLVWTPEKLALVKNANAENGKIAAEKCGQCHGKQGQGQPQEIRDDDEPVPAIPALAGQSAYYLFKQLQDYKHGDRVDMSMANAVQNISEQQAADFAAWFAAMAVPKPNPSISPEDIAIAEKLITAGDPNRDIAPCQVCHGQKGEGQRIDMPRLAGQQAGYFVDTMGKFMATANNPLPERHNDNYGRMRGIKLTDQEIKALAAYYQSLR